MVDINPAGAALAGEPPGKVIGRPAQAVFEALPGLVDHIETVDPMAAGEVEVDIDGTERHYSMTTWPLRDHQDRVLGRLVTLHDVTELRLAQEELERTNAELDGYAHTVSHDLKGPLAAISLSSETVTRLLGMEESEKRDHDIVALMDLIHGNVKKSASLVSCLLALAEAGQKPVTIEEVQLNDVVERVLEEHRGDIDDRGTRVEAGPLGSLRADPTHIYQLFANLLSNALRHGASAKPTVKVELLGAEDGIHRYLVRDNGPGIPEKDMDRIFDAFYKLGDTGTGIGLSTAQRIVKVYGGDIRAYNDNGACFEFTLKDWTGPPT